MVRKAADNKSNEPKAMSHPNLKQTFAYFKADLHRRLALEDRKNSLWNVLCILPKRSVISVLIYRLKRYLYFKNSTIASVMVRLLKFLEFYYCHNELDPRADIGHGLVLGDLGGVALGFTVVIGKNCTFMGKGTPTLGAMEGIDLEKDRITIGDYCIFGHNAKVINPVTIADGVQVSPNSVLMISVKSPGAIVAGFPAKVIGTVPMNDIKTWSPLLSRHLDIKHA